MIDTKSIIEKLKPLDPEKIILFGSHAKGNATPESDIDLLIIRETKKKPAQRVGEALKLVWGNVPQIEPCVLTPLEFQRAIEENRFFITQEVIPYGKVIYEK